jgi:hypothetical protein
MEDIVDRLRDYKEFWSSSVGEFFAPMILIEGTVNDS